MSVSLLAPKYVRDLRASNIDVTVTGTLVISGLNNPTDGQVVKWRIRQDGTGGHTVSLSADFRIPSSASPLTWSTEADTTDILAAIYNSTDSIWDVVSFVPGY